MTEKLFTRDTWRPKSFDDETSSVRVVAVTENPVRVWDWNSKQYIEEVLLVDGFSLPPSGRIPLLDAHNRSSVSSVLGSARRFHPSGTSLECDVFFSGTDAGRNAAQNVKEGHLTDFSVGYFPVESYYIKDGESKDINGRSFRGPVKVTAKWNLRELSLTPIGADQYATARSENGIISSPEGQIPSPAPMPPPLTQPVQPIPAVPSPVSLPSPERSMPSAPQPEVQPPISQPVSASPQPFVQNSSHQDAVLPLAEPLEKPDAGERAKPAAPQPPKDKKPPQAVKRDLEQDPEAQTERQKAPPPKPGQQAAKPAQPVERDFVDMIFYAFLAIAVLFILKGMFL